MPSSCGSGLRGLSQYGLAGLYGGIGAGDRQAAAALLSNPVLVRQNGTGSKQVGINAASLRIDGSKMRVNAQTGLMDRMAFAMKQFFTVPLAAVGRLVDRQIEDGFPDGMPVGMQSLSKKAAAGKYNRPRPHLHLRDFTARF